MVDQIAISTPNRRIDAGSVAVITARFRDRASASAAIPTTASYRFDDDYGRPLTDWTDLIPASEVTVTLSATDTRILNCTHNVEYKLVTIAADRNTDTEYRDSYLIEVVNLSFPS